MGLREMMTLSPRSSSEIGFLSIRLVLSKPAASRSPESSQDILHPVKNGQNRRGARSSSMPRHVEHLD